MPEIDANHFRLPGTAFQEVGSDVYSIVPFHFSSCPFSSELSPDFSLAETTSRFDGRRRKSDQGESVVLLMSVSLHAMLRLQEITAVRARFPKPVLDYSAVMFFGRNIVASEGEEWKKYRKVSAPAFSDVRLAIFVPTGSSLKLFPKKNNVLVWDESVRIVSDMMDNVWENKEEVVVDHCVDITLPVSFMHGSNGPKLTRLYRWLYL